MSTDPEITPETFPCSLPRSESSVALVSARAGVVVHVSADSTAIEVPINPGTALKMWSWLTRWLLHKAGLRLAVAPELGKILSTLPTGWREEFLAAVTDGADVPWRLNLGPVKGFFSFSAQEEQAAKVKRFEKDVPVKQVLEYAQERVRQTPDGVAGPLVMELAYVFLGVPKEVLEPYLPQPVDPDAELVERIARIKYKEGNFDWDLAGPLVKESSLELAREYLRLVRTAQQELEEDK